MGLPSAAGRASLRAGGNIMKSDFRKYQTMEAIRRFWGGALA